MALDPNFASNHFIYVFWCHKTTPTSCDVQRLIENNGAATFDKTLLTYEESANDHTGGRLKIGPDNMLYLSVGDWDNPPLAQDPSTFAGKILRFNLDGTAAAGNPDPSSPYVYASGFRDPQGLAWDSSGQLYATDHGPTANDEVNIINAGPTTVGRRALESATIRTSSTPSSSSPDSRFRPPEPPSTPAPQSRNGPVPCFSQLWAYPETPSPIISIASSSTNRAALRFPKKKFYSKTNLAACATSPRDPTDSSTSPPAMERQLTKL
jgi:hypothetical protein